jgi:hypothetical protein
MPRQYAHPMFAKRHYEVIAAVLRAAYCGLEREDMVVDRIVDDVAGMFKDDNPCFSTERFRKACEHSATLEG